ncbi:CDC48 family AAA ATPase [Halochromatium glycolicum]|uniref:AAA family ATPase n=1 Tax=Halochromatium glycolicum TaxID=85075 RepID=A0AAJ0U8R6_9GAMM|nr:CDC48 family AAA ATPase [Halochromatium glycolicum]MBK1706840.1 AAA family ATPase [Halochromatium glycolicum]
MRDPLKLRVAEALAKDVGRGYARLDPADIGRLGLELGEVVCIKGSASSVAKVMPAYPDMRGQHLIQLDGITRKNAGVAMDEQALVEAVPWQAARRVVLIPTTVTPGKRDLDYIGSLLDGLPVVKGDLVRASLFGSRSADFSVADCDPRGAVVINPTTSLVIGKRSEDAATPTTTLTYEDVGGLRNQVHRIREMIELPLRHPQIFERLGIDAPKGVLLHGPPGCGKTLIARIIAQESDANFFSVSGPEVVHKFYGESEAHLRKIFEEAARKGPSIIFMDEIDAIAPRRDKVVGDVEKRIVAQLLALMDGLTRRQNLIVIAATNLPNAIDPALRRPGRFDRELGIPIPDRDGRLEILEIHSRGMPLDDDVALPQLAEITHGFVGADLEALCREAAMSTLRRVLPDIGLSLDEMPIDRLAGATVGMDDFITALREVEPSAIRELFVEVPDVGWKDVGGLDAIRQRLVEAVQWPLSYPALFEQAGVRPPKGLLLAGPPGVGKTMIAKAIANESGVNVIAVKGPELMSRFVGESEAGVRELFQKARQAAPCIIFLDEVDAVVPARGAGATDSHVAERVLSQFLAELDGLEELKGVFVLGATNRADLIDAAMLRPGRFDEVVEIPLPNEADRRAILDVHLRDKPGSELVNIDQLAAGTAGASGADLAALCNRAALRAIRRAVAEDSGDPGAVTDVRLETDDIECATAEVLGDLAHRPRQLC